MAAEAPRPFRHLSPSIAPKQEFSAVYRGNAEADIRSNLVRKGYVKGIIGLPANPFYGTVVIDKEHASARKGIFMIDASGGFMKDGPKKSFSVSSACTRR
jgi:type I restriction-modification system DNA methylase subunit